MRPGTARRTRRTASPTSRRARTGWTCRARAGPAGRPSTWLDGGDFTASGTPEARQESEGGSTRLLLDTDGDGTADAALELAGDVLLTTADLVL